MPRNHLLRRCAISLMAIAILTASACSDDGDGDSQPSETTESPVEDTQATVPESLLYLDGTTLTSLDLGEMSTEEISSLPSADVDLAPDGRRYAVVRETAPGAPDPDGFRQPAIDIGAIEGGGTLPLGPGRSPRWSPDSSLVAAIVPAAARIECPAGVDGDDEGMCAPEKVVAYDPEANSSVDLLGTEPRWFLVGWSGDQVVAIGLRGEMSAAVPGESPHSFVGLTSTEVWDVSPADQQFVTLFGQSNAQITDFEGRELHRIDLEGARLADGEWSPDGSKVAAVFLNTSETPPVARMGIIDATTGAVEFVPDEESAQGQVVWGADGSFAYIGTAPVDPGLLQVIHCSPGLGCEPLFEWSEGVRLLGLV